MNLRVFKSLLEIKEKMRECKLILEVIKDEDKDTYEKYLFKNMHFVFEKGYEAFDNIAQENEHIFNTKDDNF